MNIFATDLGNDVNDPGDSWAGIVDIGSCLADSASATANAATRVAG